MRHNTRNPSANRAFFHCKHTMMVSCIGLLSFNDTSYRSFFNFDILNSA